MATRLSEAHRRDVNELVRLASVDLAVVFRRATSAVDARDGLFDVLPSLVNVYGTAAATLGADWYDDLRDESNARGRFTAITAETPHRSRIDALARWGVGPMFSADPKPAVALAKTAGGLQRIIANVDRETITGSSTQDRGARGWERETSGGCDFCVMLADRGAVYTEDTADFETHDDCRCIAVPVFD